MSTITLQAPLNSTGFAHAGKSYTPDADGLVEMPAEIIAEAISHGFTVAKAKPKPAKGKPAKEDAPKAKSADDE